MDVQVVGACRGGSRSKGRRQERDVLLLVLCDLLEALADPRGEAGLGKVVRVELGEGAGVERVLKVLQGQRVIEDLDVCGDGGQARQ